MKKSIHWGMPVSYAVEPMNACNLQCPECPVGQKNLHRHKGKMSFELFKLITDQMAKRAMYVTLYFQGEPLMNNELPVLINYAKQKKLMTAISTNGHYLTDEVCQKLIRAGLNRLIISLDGLDQASYEQYRVGGNVQVVKEGIERIVKWKQKLNAKTLFIELQMLVLKSNEQQIEEVKRFARITGVDQVTFKSAQFYQYKNGNPLMPDNTKYSRYILQSDGTYRLKRRIRNRCYRMWSACVITWDGYLVPCCFDKDALHKMGKISPDTIVDIWKGHALNAFRNQIINNRKQIDICTNCTE